MSAGQCNRRRPPPNRSRPRRAGARPCASRRRFPAAPRRRRQRQFRRASSRGRAGHHRSRRKRKRQSAAPHRLVVAAFRRRLSALMKSGWVDADAEAIVAQLANRFRAKPGVDRDLALRIYTTRLLGRDPKLVLHGGGNTSLKARTRDRLGDEVEVLRVKATGADMAAIEPEGFCAVRLAPMRKLRALDRDRRRGTGRHRARQPDRSGGAQSFRRDDAARLPAAQIRRPHPCECGAQPDRPARRREKMRRCFRAAARLRALPDAGLRLGQKGNRSLRTGEAERWAHPQQTRHRHLRRGRARSLRAHDRNGVARRGVHRAATQVGRGVCCHPSAADVRAGADRAYRARGLQRKGRRDRRRLAPADRRIPRQR